MKPRRELPVRFQLNPDEINYLAATPPNVISFDSLHGKLVVVADWTLDSKSSQYRPSNAELTIESVSMAVMLEELVAAARQLAEGAESVPPVVIHGTPLELGIDRVGDIVSLRLVEAINYSEEERILGRFQTTVGGLLELVAELGLQFISQVIAANPALEGDPGLRSLKDELESLRGRA